MRGTCSGNLSKYIKGTTKGAPFSRRERKNLICQAENPLPLPYLSPATPGPTGAESKSNLYLWILSRACSPARPPGSRSLLWHPAHTSRIVGRAFVLYFFYGRARYDENGEITGVYFCESSWILLSWPYSAASARLRAMLAMVITDGEKSGESPRGKNEDPRNSNRRVRSLR